MSLAQPADDFEQLRAQHLLDQLERTPLQRLQRMEAFVQGVMVLRHAVIQQQRRREPGTLPATRRAARPR